MYQSASLGPVYDTRSAYDSGLVVNAPTMNKTDVNGYVQDRTFASMFPPVCLKTHWDSESLSSKYVLPGDLRIPLPVDPRPLFRNCTTYVTSAPAADVSAGSDKRATLGLAVQPGGGAAGGAPYEVYVRNVNAESDLWLNHPQDKCDDNKFVPDQNSDLYTNTHAPPKAAADSFSELARPLATVVPNGPYVCRTTVDEQNWEKSTRLFNNPTREDRVPGAAARSSEALLSKKAAITARVAAAVRVWPSNSVVFYVGAGTGGDMLTNLAQALRARDWEITIYSPARTQVVEGITYQHIGEFVPNDKYSCLVLWNSESCALLGNFQYKPDAKALLLNLEESADKEVVCARGVKEMVNKIVVRSAFHRSLYDCYSWSKFEIIADGLPVRLFTDVENRSLPREAFRVLITEYTMPLIAFVQQAWVRIKATYPGAELHVWSKAGDLKDKVLPTLAGSARGLGVVLHGQGDLNEMVRERFRSNVHVYLAEEDLIACDSVRMSSLAGCIPLMPNRGVLSELKGINIEGSLGSEKTMIDYAKAISALFKDAAGTNKMRRRNQVDESLKGWNATADRWLTIFKGLRSSTKI